MSTERQKLIEEFVSVTGSDQNTAKHLLDACSDDLPRAIEMFLDDKGETSGVAAPVVTAPNTEEVRAPIPHTSGVLVDDPHYVSVPRDRWSSRRRPRSVFDGFRDFKAETSLQEGLASSNQINPGRKRLEDLFRPPLDLMHRGTFETARESGRVSSKWLMVNVQNVREFSCQVLNRDVWSVKQLQNLIRKHFVFWQVYSGSTEGDRFTTFYPVKCWPHVSILDPRTGERLAVWNELNADNIEGKVAEFLADHGTMNEEESESSEPPAKRTKTEDYLLIDRSEESQLAVAIAASLAETESQQRITISDLDEDYGGSNDETSDFSALDVSEDDEIIIDDSDSKESSNLTPTLANTAQKPENIVKNSPINQTEVDEKFFTQSVSETSKLQNGKSKNITYSEEKLYKKVHKKLKIGSVPNGKDMSRLTIDSYSTSQSDSSKTSTVKPEDLCRIMIRYPDGSREEIAMDVNLTVESLQSKLIIKGYPREDYDLVTHFPRKNIYSLGLEKTLREVGLYPRSAVFVEEIER